MPEDFERQGPNGPGRDDGESDHPVSAANDPEGPSIWAVGGGKGGVGKSIIATNLAVLLARRGYRVTLFDGDLGGANVDTLVGCRVPQHTLADFFSRRVAALTDLLIPTPIEGLSIICGDSDTLGAANPQHSQKLKLIRHLRTLPCNIVVVDLGAGTSFNTLDMFLAADVGVAVTTPEPTALQNCFTFIKAVTLRDLERRSGVKRRKTLSGSIRSALAEAGAAGRDATKRRTRLVVNRARRSDGRRVLDVLNGMVSRFLGGSLELSGVIREDAAVRSSIQRMMPLVDVAPHSDATEDLRSLCDQMLGPQQPVTEAIRMGLNEELIIGGTYMHLQTEDLGDRQGAIRSQVFFRDGRVGFSRRTPYIDKFFARLGVAPDERARYHHAAIKRALESGRLDLEERKSA